MDKTLKHVLHLQVDKQLVREFKKVCVDKDMSFTAGINQAMKKAIDENKS